MDERDERVIIGSPEEVVEQLTELATDLNVGHLMLLMQFGNMGKDLPPITRSCSPIAY
jgi:alkanesulfonate monooxygenase SsuD/methylene tetrahydromethanopterin reductase-like flavin-dependent oxidoreductase (luciferase family)